VLLRRVVHGISCRNYVGAAAAIPGAMGLPASAVSRSFVQAGAARLKRFQERDLSTEDDVAIFLDGKTFAGGTCRSIDSASARSLPQAGAVI
jgi:hypothetical protein